MGFPNFLYVWMCFGPICRLVNLRLKGAFQSLVAMKMVTMEKGLMMSALKR